MPRTQQVRWPYSPLRLLATSISPSRSRAIQPSGSPWQKACTSPFLSATGSTSPGNTRHSTSLFGIDAGAMQHDREEVAVGRGEVGDADRLALELLELGDAAVAGREQPHAAAMDAGRDLDVEAVLQRLQPAQRHADAGISLAGRDRLEQLVGRAAEIDQLDVEIVLARRCPSPAPRQRRRCRSRWRSRSASARASAATRPARRTRCGRSRDRTTRATGRRAGRRAARSPRRERACWQRQHRVATYVGW